MAENKSEGFLNVYNFIPFPKKKGKRYEDEDRHTGVIQYEITTKTPLFIPNTSNADAYGSEEHKSYDFFSYTELKGKTDYEKAYEPVIPGSELRGMIRSLYEILTDSCMSVLNAEERPVKRTAEIFKPALIERKENNQFVLIEAEGCIFRENDDKNRDTYRETDFKEGQKVYFEKIPRFKEGSKGKNPVTSLIIQCSQDKSKKYPDDKSKEYPDEGYLIKGMKSPGGRTRKHNARIFMKGMRKLFDLEDKDIEGLSLVLASYQEQPQAEKDSYREYKDAYDHFLKGEGEPYFPVYYSDIEGEGANRCLYLAPAMITKENSNVTIGELAGDFSPCQKVGCACPACGLFGMTGESNEESLGSKIRFSDACAKKKMDPEKYYMTQVTLQELAKPKLGNTEFYLEHPDNADFWTYDYHIKKGNIVLEQGKLRGRKFYWNQPDVKLPKKVEKTKRNKTVRPVRSGISFIGELYYDGISEKQLRQLIWILNGGSRTEGEDDIVYKLGAGKPLGLGSVELKVTEVKERILEEKNGYLSYKNCPQEDYLRIGNYAENGFAEGCRKEFFNMTAYKKMKGKHITYPVTLSQRNQQSNEEGLKNGYEWFVQNHRFYSLKNKKVDFDSAPRVGGMAQKRSQHNIGQVLPKADEICPMPYKLS